MNQLAERYKEDAKEYINPSGGVIDYFPYFRKSRYKNAGKLFEKAAAEYTACDAANSAAECYFSAGYNFMLADVFDKAAQCYILSAKMYKPIEYNKSITAYLHASDIFETQRRPDMCIKCCDTVACVYAQNGKYKEAVQFYEQCVKTACKEGYSPVHYQEKIAAIQITQFGYFATAITVYDSIIQNALNEQIVYPFMMIAILLRILEQQEMTNIHKYIDWCLGIKGFVNTDYFMFVNELMVILESNRGSIGECYAFYKEREKKFSNTVVAFLVSKMMGQ